MTIKSARIISNSVYVVGVFTVVILGVIALFGSNQRPNTDAMIPINQKEQAFMWLASGAIPILFASMVVYKLNLVKNSLHKNRNVFLIFLPSFICVVCALFIIGILIGGMINSFLLQ